MNDLLTKENGVDIFPCILPTVDETPLPIDVLNRQETLEQILDLLITLSETRSSCTFALNGKWGAGKSFILDMLEAQLRNYQAGERFMVFHYNCWQYDYYDEPLTAIVSAMLDDLDKQIRIMPVEVMDKIKLGYVATKEVLKKVAYSFVENKIGIDINIISEVVDKVHDAASQQAERQHEYDKYYAFNKVVKSARKELLELSEQQTLVVVVDELDRCLPDYTIKILERLHHLFAGLDNTVLIAAVDKTQLEHTVKMIFGDHTDCGAYLKKFIDFELEIDIGTVNNNFLTKYSDYVELFDDNLLETWHGLNDYISALFSGIEVRRQEHLVKKIHTIHRLLFSKDEKKDYSFLCFELFMAVMSENSNTPGKAPLYYDLPRIPGRPDYTGCQLTFDNNVHAQLKNYIAKNWKYAIGICQTGTEHYPFYNGALDIPLLVICYSELTYGESGILSNHPEHSKYDAYIDDFKAIKRMLEIIK